METVYQIVRTMMMVMNRIDTDSDGIGNNTDLDDDGDGVADTEDMYPLIMLPWMQIQMVMVFQMTAIMVYVMELQ